MSSPIAPLSTLSYQLEVPQRVHAVQDRYNALRAPLREGLAEHRAKQDDADTEAKEDETDTREAFGGEIMVVSVAASNAPSLPSALLAERLRQASEPQHTPGLQAQEGPASTALPAASSATRNAPPGAMNIRFHAASSTSRASAAESVHVRVREGRDALNGAQRTAHMPAPERRGPGDATHGASIIGAMPDRANVDAGAAAGSALEAGNAGGASEGPAGAQIAARSVDDSVRRDHIHPSPNTQLTSDPARGAGVQDARSHALPPRGADFQAALAAKAAIGMAGASGANPSTLKLPLTGLGHGHHVLAAWPNGMQGVHLQLRGSSVQGHRLISQALAEGGDTVASPGGWIIEASDAADDHPQRRHGQAGTPWEDD